MDYGQTIAERYIIISELAMGGMGITYRAWDKVLARPVVIKLPNQSGHNNSLLLARFSREIELMRRYTHQNIVPVIGSGKLGERPYIAMPFLPGGSLADRQRGERYGTPRPKPPEALFLWLPAIAEALDFLREKNVVHRDVKPSNIFFDAYFGARLGDFGLAKNSGLSEDLTESNAGLGTVPYTAPEQLAQSKSVDARADQYSLAVTVFEYLAGQKPFTGERKHVVLEVMQDDPPDLADVVPGLPESLCMSVRRAMARLPDARFATCQDFVEAVCRGIRVPQVPKDVARMLCPSCKRIIKLRPSAAGRTGKCPKCQIPMTAASDLSAFWLVSENPAHTKLTEIGDLPEAVSFDEQAAEQGSLFERNDFSGILSNVLVNSSVGGQECLPVVDVPKPYLGDAVVKEQKSKSASLPLMKVVWLLVFSVACLFSLLLYEGFNRKGQIKVKVVGGEPKFGSKPTCWLNLSDGSSTVSFLPEVFGWRGRELVIEIQKQRSGDQISVKIDKFTRGGESNRKTTLLPEESLESGGKFKKPFLLSGHDGILMEVRVQSAETEQEVSGCYYTYYWKE